MDYDWCAKGRRNEDVVWKQALYDENARELGQCSASALLDLKKAFETVSLHHPWKAGPRYGFPLATLRATLEIFSFGRVLNLDQAIALPVRSLSAILAGSRFATDILYLTLLEPCDRIQALCPLSSLAVVVDDFSIQTVGSTT